MSTLVLMPYVRSELAENYKMMNLGATPNKSKSTCWNWNNISHIHGGIVFIYLFIFYNNWK